MNELYSMSVASTMMDHTNEVAKELFNLKIVAKIICYCENMIYSSVATMSVGSLFLKVLYRFLYIHQQ